MTWLGDDDSSEGLVQALRASLAMRDKETADLLQELAEARELAERGWARVKRLERRLRVIGKSVRGELDGDEEA